MDYEIKCQKIISFFNLRNKQLGKSKYNSDAFESMLEYYEATGDFSGNQERAIDNTINGFKIK